MSLVGQNLNLPHRNSNARFTPINGHKVPLARSLLDLGVARPF